MQGKVSIDNFVSGLIGILIALLIFAAIFPEIIASFSSLLTNPNLSAAEVALLGIVTLLIVAGVVLWIWNLIRPKSGKGRK